MAFVCADYGFVCGFVCADCGCVKGQEEDGDVASDDLFLDPEVIKERDEKKEIIAAQTLQINMDARDALLDSLSAMAAVTTLNKAAIDRMSKSNGRILAGNPLELSEMAQALAVKQN